MRQGVAPRGIWQTTACLQPGENNRFPLVELFGTPNAFNDAVILADHVREADAPLTTRFRRNTRMKRQIAQFFLAALMSGAALNAQRPFDANGGSLGSAQTSADAVARRLQFLTTLLTLTTSQASQATTIFTNEAAAVTAIQTNLDTARTSLKTAIQSNSTAQIDQLSSQIGTYQGQLLAADSKAEAAFYALLTADQKTKYDAIGAGHGGPGGPGGPRG